MHDLCGDGFGATTTRVPWIQARNRDLGGAYSNAPSTILGGSGRGTQGRIPMLSG